MLIIFAVAMQVCHSNPSERSRFIRCIYNLLSSGSLAVRYEAAGTLVTLSNAPSAIKVRYYKFHHTHHGSTLQAAAQCYVDLIIKESDNNVKLIVLDRLIGLKNTSATHEKILQVHTYSKCTILLIMITKAILKTAMHECILS